METITETFIVDFFAKILSTRSLRKNRDSNGRFVSGNKYQIVSIPTTFGDTTIMPNGFSSTHCKWNKKHGL